MKAIMIIYNQAHTEKVEFLLDKLGIKGYSLWENVQGRGSETGVPHLGTHAWPEINKSVLTIVEDELVDKVEQHKEDRRRERRGWNSCFCVGRTEVGLRILVRFKVKGLSLRQPLFV